MSTAANDAEQLERLLFKRGLGLLLANRSRCTDCGRTPLEGELIHFYEERDATLVVCELCRQLRRSAPLGSELVRHSEHGHTVRIRRAA
jgi:hypothetical protein